MPKSKSAVKNSTRANPLAKKTKAKKPQVQVTYEDGETRPNVLSIPRVDIKGKGKAQDVEDLPESDSEEEDDEEDVKPIIIKEEDGDFQKAFEQQMSSESAGSSSASFIIVAGSYEKNLYGIEGTFVTSVEDTSATPELKLVPTFIFPAHLGCIKSLAVSQGAKWLVTGSEDEFIKVWDLRRRKEVGSLSEHVGTITSLTFPSASHLLSTSEDSTITVFRTRDWVPLRTLKGHSGKVNCVDVHPSGKVALSVGKDQTLRMWDLMRGRGASSLGLGYEAELVRFSKSGKLFAILGYSGIEVYTISMKKVATLAHPKRKRLHDIRFGEVSSPSGENVELMFSGTEDGKVYAWSIDEEQATEEAQADEDAGDVCDLMGIFGGHTNRVKSVDFLVTKRPTPHSPLPIIVTVSSDGTMNVYDASAIFTTSSVSEEIGPMASYDTLGSRLVCCCVAEVTKTNKQVQAASQIKVETVKKEEPTQTRFKDDGESGEDDGAAGDDAEPEEEEEEEEEEQEEEVEDEVEEE